MFRSARSKAMRASLVGVAAIAIASAAAPLSAFAGHTPQVADVQLLAINDFHGNLQPPSGSSGRIGTTDAGGIEYLATYMKQLKATNKNRTIEVSAGDNIGGSPLLSAAFHDEPTIQGLNKLGLDVSAVGNHEFDEGVTELLRMQNGGCHPVDGCQDGDGFPGAQFQYLAANVVKKTNSKPILPPYTIEKRGGVKVGFIGLTLEGTPSIVSANGIQNVNFLDEAVTINHYATVLKNKGVHTIVVLLHEGGAQSVALSESTINTCTGISGAIVPIVAALNDEVDMVISGHTHQAYNCMLPNIANRNIPVSSAASFGRLVTDIDMTINKNTDQPTAISRQQRDRHAHGHTGSGANGADQQIQHGHRADRERRCWLHHRGHHQHQQCRRRIGTGRCHRRRPAGVHAVGERAIRAHEPRWHPRTVDVRVRLWSARLRARSPTARRSPFSRSTTLS